MKKKNLKDHLTDDCLDLSLCDLQDVPVKDIAAIPRVTNLDLSSNKLVTLGVNFAPSLAHLVKLDLCRNQLVELPDNFGLLVNLKHLDLFSNQLHTLPLSFASLKSLRWLDLKGNPLVPSLAQASGPCLDAPGCQFAARNVVRHITELNSLLEATKEKTRKEQQVKRNACKRSTSSIPEKLEQKQQTQKKEAKSKKKKKKKANSKSSISNQGELEVNGVASVEEAPVEMAAPLQSSRRTPPSSSSFTRTVRTVVVWTLHLIAFSLLVLIAGLFIGGVLDHAFNHKISTMVDPYIRPIKLSVPKPARDAWMKFCSIFYQFVLHIVTSVVALFWYSLRTIVGWCVFMSTNPTIRTQLSTLGSQLLEYSSKMFVSVTNSLNNLILSLGSFIK